MRPLLLFLCFVCTLYSAEDKHPAPPAPTASGSLGSAVVIEPDQNTPIVSVPINKSVVLEHPAGVRRMSIANGDLVEAVAVSSTEILLNGKVAGETSLILWDPKGKRSNFDVHVLPDSRDIDAVRGELMREIGPSVSISVDGKTVFLRGTAKDAISAERAFKIASALGNVVNLLRVKVPAGSPQILLKVRFATVERTAAEQFGFNVFSMNQKGIANSSTNQFGNNPQLQAGSGSQSVAFNDLLNIFYFRPDLNIGAFIQALESKNVLQILAEPNLLTVSGEPANFLAGGEFPFPTIQGGAAGVGQITIQFKEFGIRLNFLPYVTPRGSILLKVSPEVSSLDYSNGLTVNGFAVPGLSTRRVQTEIELENQQSFVIAGLLDKQITEQLNKIPGLASIPLLGKLFQSKSLQKNDTELLIVVTPELVAPIPASAAAPNLNMPLPFGKDMPATLPRNPGPDVTGQPSPIQKIDTLPIEQLDSLPLPSSVGQGSSNGNMGPQAAPSVPIPSAPSGGQQGSGTVKQQ